MADSYSRDRKQFGADAAQILKGVKLILDALEMGFLTINNIPPGHHRALKKSLDQLIDTTDRFLVGDEIYDPNAEEYGA